MTTAGTSSAPAPASIGINPLKWRRAWLSMDKNPIALRWAQTYFGQIVMHAGFLALFFCLPFIRTKYFALAALALIAAALLPGRRMMVLAGFGLVYFLLRPLRQEGHYRHLQESWQGLDIALPMQFGLTLTGLIFLGLTALLIANSSRQWVTSIARHPVQLLFALWLILCCAVGFLPTGTFLASGTWLMLAFMSGNLFFVGYILLDQRNRDLPPLSQQMGFLRPVWVPGALPIKGPGYFKKFEAQNAEALAATRLKAIKLIVWATLLSATWELVFIEGAYARGGLLRLDEAIAALSRGDPLPLAENWLVLAVAFVGEIIAVGASVHAVVALIRMAGFAIPRGMARPLSSRTISEFWGRYLYYFKELLSDFFFFPTFQRCFKRYPRLRIAFATFMAAFVGNLLFDIVTDAPGFVIAGYRASLEAFFPYAVYAAALTAGILWSQLLQRQPKPEMGRWRYDVLPRIQVIVFFSLLQIFDNHSGELLLSERIRFFFSLFGVNP